MGGDYVTESVAGCLAALRPAVERDWTKVRAAGLEWNCHETAVHIADDLIAYAANLAGRAQDAYVPFELKLDEGTDNAGLLHVIETTGALLAAAVRTAPREARAFHPYPFRSANREGFAAMGIAEVVLHTRDLAGGLGLAYEPRPLSPSSSSPASSRTSSPAPTTGAPSCGPPAAANCPAAPRSPSGAGTTTWSFPPIASPSRASRPRPRDLVAGGDGGFEWIDGGPFDGTREASGFLLKAYEGGVHRPEFGVFALVRREDGRAIGGIGFHGAPDEEGRAEIGYDLVEGGRGNGYATEALRALSQWALARDDVRTLFATVERDNLPSQAVVTRAGFRKVSEVEEGLAYELRD